jgi:hypothetical protein
MESTDNIYQRNIDAAIAGFTAFLEERPTFIYENLFEKKPRVRRPKIDLINSEWGRLINCHEIWNPHSFAAKKFRSRFRVPWLLFKNFLLPACKNAKMFNQERESYISIEFKILIGLRMLGKGNDCDTIEELSSIPKSTVNYIFNTFVKEFNSNFFAEHVYMPEGEERERMMDVFARVGFPGAVGSMDVTHVRWYRCPKSDYNLCKGKYPFTTLASQAIVDHNRRILFMSDLYNGRENDKTITMDDDVTYQIVVMGKLNDVTFKMYDAQGILKKYKGAYLIVDGGYQKYPCLIDPMHNACGHKETHWSEFLESVRKDVECTFGILKHRFRILRNGLECSSRDTANDIVKTCAILHNMLLVFDGLDEFTWEKDYDWENDDPEMSDSDIFFHEPSSMNDNLSNQPLSRHRAVVVDTTPIGHSFLSTNTWQYSQLRSALVDHLYYQWIYGRLDWPRQFRSDAKRCHPMNRIRREMLEIMTNSLYSKRADIVYVNEGVRYDCGKGLFSNILLPGCPDGIRLVMYKGEYIDVSEVDRRVAAGLGGYIIQTSSRGDKPYLDCRHNRLRGICKASFANTALHAFNISTSTNAANNCDISVHGEVVYLRTKPNISIPAHRELLCAYQSSFIMPGENRVWVEDR